MTTRYFFSADGQTYLGGFDGEAALALVPADAIEVPEAAHGLDKIDPVTKTIIPYVEPVPLLDRLTAIFDSLSADDQAAFAQLDSVVFVQVQKGRIALAKTLVTNTTVPDTLADVKTQILAELDKG